MSTSSPITDAVKAALYYAKPTNLTIDELDFAYDQMAKHTTDEDRERVCSQLAAAARILADEVVRLRAEQQSQSIALSDCCEAPAVVAGKPGSTQWYVCPQCCQPCDVFIRTTTQPL